MCVFQSAEQLLLRFETVPSSYSQGDVVGHRRKILPTGVERVIFGSSSGDTVDNVVNSPFGRLGSLQCWEHAQPLLKYHTASLRKLFPSQRCRHAAVKIT